MKGPVSRRDTLRLSAAAACAGVGGDVAAIAAEGQGGEAARPRVSVAAFGAKGDGASDDSAAFQAALDTGADVFVPAAPRHYLLKRTLATASPGQRIAGEGDRSHLMQTGADANATVLALLHDHATVTDLRITPGTATRNLNQGWGVAVTGARHCTVARCRIDGMRRGGVLLNDAALCLVRENRFLASVVAADGATMQADMGYDVLATGSASQNVICDNLCVSGCGTGIGCQTVSDGKSQSGNVIRANVIRGHPCYGIMIYFSGGKGSVSAITISGNTIDAISGTVRTAEGTGFYGAGIYVQTANDFLIEGNRLSATNTDRRRPLSGSAVPAAIAVSGCGNGVIADNMIRDCYDGIASIQATVAVPEGEGTLIGGNIISECDRIGINLSDCAAATVSANRLSGRNAAQHGIFVHRASAGARMTDFVINANVVKNFEAGIEIDGRSVERASVSGNIVTDNRGYAIVTTAAISLVTGNIVRGAHGIALLTSAQSGWCRDNVLDVKGLAIIDDSGAGVTVRDNILPTGPSKVSTGLALRDTAGPTRGRRWLSWPAGTPLKDLGTGFEGQERAILAEGTVGMIDGAVVLRGRADRILAAGEVASFVYLAGRWRETG